jgi:Integrase core domain
LTHFGHRPSEKQTSQTPLREQRGQGGVPLASRTKTKSPQTNGICERFHKTVLNEFYRVAFRKKVYRSIDALQTDLDLWVREYNEQRPHQDAGALAKPQCKPSWTLCLSQGRK